MTLNALILDVDGTLAETADVKRAAFNQAFAEFGLNWVWSRAVFAQVLANARAGNEIEFFLLLRAPDQFNRLERSGLFGKLARRQRQIYLGLLETGAATLRPGIARLMAEAVQTHLKIALCSTGSRDEFETLVFNRFGLEMVNALACSVSGEELTSPSPVQAYRACAKKLGCAPASCVVIEDSSQGVAAAASLGFRVIATPSQYTWRGKFPGAHLVLSDLGHPAAPFAVLSGTAPDGGYMTLSDMKSWHNAVGWGKIAA